MDLNSILKSPPKVHDWGSGDLTATGLPSPVFEFMDRALTSESISLETGMGISTAVFAIKSGTHVCVSPDQNEINRFREYAIKNNFSIDHINFICKKSYEIWNDLKDHLWDLILIDGGHGFPTPFMDWYFFSQRLKINGYIIIDDTHLSTCKTLKDFLLKEDAWQIVPPFSKKTVIFQKVKEFDYNKEFNEQRYVMEQTAAMNKFEKLKNFPGHVKWKLEKFAKGLIKSRQA